jgi:hypothetical protein
MVVFAAMRCLILLALVAGCGSSGDSCPSLQSQMAGVAAANRSCAQDSDCSFAYDLDDCATFYSRAGRDQMGMLEQQFSQAGCHTSCMALLPGCNAGVCGVKTPP